MISRADNGGFFAAHYDWIVAGIGLLALAGGAAFYAMSLGEDDEEASAEAVGQINRMRPAANSVKPVDMTAYSIALRAAKSPTELSDIPEKAESFLASERRILCKKCGKGIPDDIKNVPECPFCGDKREAAKVVVFDADNDGLPDEWENKFKFNASNAEDANLDADGDGFTNLEEFKAKTDPRDAKSHPDYLDSLKIVLPLNETYVPFVFRKANKIPTGWRLEFLDPKRKDDYGRLGATLTAKVGEEIADTGYVVKDYQVKSVKQKIQGTDGLTKQVDASEALIERKRDGKQLTLVIQQGKLKALKFAPIDIQVKLTYERGVAKTFEAIPGTEITLNGAKFKVLEIKAVGKGANVTIEELSSGRKRTLAALE